MLTWNVTYHVKPGQRDAFYQALCRLGVRENSRTEEGNLKYDYYFAAEDENALLLVESWTAPELQAAHTKTDKFAALMELKAQYVEDTSIDKFTF